MTMFAVVCLTLLGGMAIMPEFSEPITNDPDPDGTDQLDPVNPSDFLDILIEYGDETDQDMLGTAGMDRIFGDLGDDYLAGFDGDDELIGGQGDDTVLGGAGNDTLAGQDGHDELQGDGGSDILNGGFGNDTSLAGSGDDIATGGQGNDIADGGQGNDALHGNDGDDTLLGGIGHDSLFGGAGDDIVYGDDDADTDYLNGGQGNDQLHMGENDIASGGSGSDVFYHTTQSGTAEITDFDPNVDRIVLSAQYTELPDIQIIKHKQGCYGVILNDTACLTVHSSAPLSADMIELRTTSA